MFPLQARLYVLTYPYEYGDEEVIPSNTPVAPRYSFNDKGEWVFLGYHPQSFTSSNMGYPEFIPESFVSWVDAQILEFTAVGGAIIQPEQGGIITVMRESLVLKDNSLEEDFEF